MNTKKNEKGQTVIETALLIILLLVLFFGIAEIARAWWYKGQLGTAARAGAREQVVQNNISAGGACSFSGGRCTGGDTVVAAACNSITTQDLCNSAVVVVNSDTTCSSTGTIVGACITVSVAGSFTTALPGLIGSSSGLMPAGPLQATMVMRHE